MTARAMERDPPGAGPALHPTVMLPGTETGGGGRGRAPARARQRATGGAAAAAAGAPGSAGCACVHVCMWGGECSAACRGSHRRGSEALEIAPVLADAGSRCACCNAQAPNGIHHRVQCGPALVRQLPGGWWRCTQQPASGQQVGGCALRGVHTRETRGWMEALPQTRHSCGESTASRAPDALTQRMLAVARRTNHPRPGPTRPGPSPPFPRPSSQATAGPREALPGAADPSMEGPTLLPQEALRVQGVKPDDWRSSRGSRSGRVSRWRRWWWLLLLGREAGWSDVCVGGWGVCMWWGWGWSVRPLRCGVSGLCAASWGCWVWLNIGGQ